MLSSRGKKLVVIDNPKPTKWLLLKSWRVQRIHPPSGESYISFIGCSFHSFVMKKKFKLLDLASDYENKEWIEQMIVLAILTPFTPRRVSTMWGYLSYESSQQRDLFIAGWHYSNRLAVNIADNTLHFILPLKKLFGIFNNSIWKTNNSNISISQY